MSEIKVGDLVMVVHQSCCGNAYGSVGTVVMLRHPKNVGGLECYGCGKHVADFSEIVAETDLPKGRAKIFPLHWLKKIDPPALDESVTTDETITA